MAAAEIPDAQTTLANVGLETLDPMGMLLVNNGQQHGQGNGHKNNDKPTGSDVKKTSTVVKDFVVDYTTATRDPLMEYETNGFTYRYVYGNDRLSVNVTGVDKGAGKLIEHGNQIRLYYHTDLRGTFDYLTSPMSQKIESWTHYNEWGEITHNAVLKCGQRELDLVKNYTGHDYDSVLSQYYAKARMYDAGDRRFTSMDPVKGNAYDPLSLVQYLYVANNPLVWIDPLGLVKWFEGIISHLGIEAYIMSLKPTSTYPNVRLEGVSSTKSGRGYADLIVKNAQNFDIYEIKPIGYYYNFPYDLLAATQVNSYKAAINYHPELWKNIDYYPAQLGTDLLNEIDGAIIPYPLDPENKYIRITTHRITHPGMIYYELVNCLREGEELSYQYTTADAVAWKNHSALKTTYVGESELVDSRNDYFYFMEVKRWLEDVQVMGFDRGNYVYTQITYPDGSTLYKYEGNRLNELFRGEVGYSAVPWYEQYLLYHRMSQSQSDWYTTETQAYWGTLFGPATGTLPLPAIPFPNLVPA